MPKTLTVADILDCIHCQDHYATMPMLLESCASIGISERKTTTQVLREYFASYHRSGHRRTR